MLTAALLFAVAAALVLAFFAPRRAFGFLDDWRARLMRLLLGLSWRLQVLVMVLLALPALAQDAVAAPSPLSGLLAQWLTPGGIAAAVGGLLAVVGLLVGNRDLLKRRLALVAYHAFHIVEDVDSDPGALGKLSKVEAGLKAADDYCKAQGWRPLKPGEQEAVKLAFASLNGQAEAAAVVAAKAQVIAKDMIAAAQPPQSPP